MSKGFLGAREGTETPRGQKPIDENDYADIPNVVQNADTITRSESDYEGKQAIEFRKKNGNELTTVVAVVSDKRLDLFVQTEYINKKTKGIATPKSEQADFNTPEATGGTALDMEQSLHTDMVQQHSEEVNR